MGESPSTQRTILIYPGTYRVTDAERLIRLDGTKENVDLVGVDRDSVIIDVSDLNTNGPGIEIVSGEEDSRNAIRNLTIVTRSGAGILITKGTGENDKVPKNITIENVAIHTLGSGDIGISGPDSDLVQVNKCSITTDDAIGMYVDQNWTIRDTTVAAYGTAQHRITGTTGALNARIINSTVFSNAGNAIVPSGDGWFLQGTFAEAPGTGAAGIHMDGTHNVQIIDCQSMGDDTGLLLDSSNGLEARGCRFRGGDKGMSLIGTSTGFLIQNCAIFGDGSIHSPEPQLVGVGTGMSMDSSTNLTGDFEECRIDAIGASEQVQGIFFKQAKLVRVVDCDITAINEANTNTAEAIGVDQSISTMDGTPRPSILIGGSITTSSAFEQEMDVYDILWRNQNYEVLRVSGTRFSKWLGRLPSAERRRPVTQRTLSASQADDGAIAAEIILTGGIQTITDVESPDVYRVLWTTSDGSDLPQAVHVVGTNWAGDQITDSIPLQNHAARRGEKAFKTVAEIVVPPGTGTISIGTTNELGLYYPISDPSDVLQQGRKSGTATSYTLEGIFMVHTRRATVEVETINAGDSFEWNYLATK